MSKRRIAILGSTGSIGRQALDIISRYPDRFEVVALTAHHRADLLFEQLRVFKPMIAALTGGECQIPADLKHIDWSFGTAALAQIAAQAPCEDVLISVVGMVGLGSVLAARQAGKRVLLANKEALVAGGQLVMDLCPADEENPTLIPVDSEHSAIYQCLLGSRGQRYERLLLTASGGPFRTFTLGQMQQVKPAQALKHPNWNMGPKITVDSATMFNKGLEMIEAKWLFDARPDQIQVLIHPQSIVHSLVAYPDGAVLAQMGMPDMRAPIAFALAFPERIANGTQPLQLDLLGTLRFEPPDEQRFPALRLARQAMEAGGAAACVLNAANEVAVAAFLQEGLSFTGIAHVVEACLQQLGHLDAHSLEAVMQSDRLARQLADKLIVEGAFKDA